VVDEANLDARPVNAIAGSGWTNWQFPDLLQPSLSVGWGLIVLGAALLLAMSIESPHSRMARVAQRRR
jgi:hypothetical protein